MLFSVECKEKCSEENWYPGRGLLLSIRINWTEDDAGSSGECVRGLASKYSGLDFLAFVKLMDFDGGGASTGVIVCRYFA